MNCSHRAIFLQALSQPAESKGSVLKIKNNVVNASLISFPGTQLSRPLASSCSLAVSRHRNEHEIMSWQRVFPPSRQDRQVKIFFLASLAPWRFESSQHFHHRVPPSPFRHRSRLWRTDIQYRMAFRRCFLARFRYFSCVIIGSPAQMTTHPKEKTATPCWRYRPAGPRLRIQAHTRPREGNQHGSDKIPRRPPSRDCHKDLF
jgi:hypothetical protein